MNLSEHFTLAELTVTSTGLPNVPPEPALELGKQLCELVLEPVRAHIDKPLKVTSGYRSPEVNSAVGGSAISDHCWDEHGVAADVTYNGNLYVLWDWLRLQSGLPFDQCILEWGKVNGDYRCIHLSYRTNPRRMAGIGATGNRSKYEWFPVVGA